MTRKDDLHSIQWSNPSLRELIYIYINVCNTQFYWSIPLVSHSSWSDYRSESKSGLGPLHSNMTLTDLAWVWLMLLHQIHVHRFSSLLTQRNITWHLWVRHQSWIETELVIHVLPTPLWASHNNSRHHCDSVTCWQCKVLLNSYKPSATTGKRRVVVFLFLPLIDELSAEALCGILGSVMTSLDGRFDDRLVLSPVELVSVGNGDIAVVDQFVSFRVLLPQG